MIRAAIKIDSMMIHTMTQDMLQDYVLSSLGRYISQQVTNNMTIDKQYDPITDETTYVGTLNVLPRTTNNYTLATAAIGTSTISGFNGTSAVNRSSVQEIFRVVEYTKNGKVTRVELQKYDDETNDWTKIPRIQIEE